MQTTAVEKAKQWSTNQYFDQETRNEILKLLETKNNTEIEERFHRDLEFGTGGLRSILGVGSNRMNKYNVRRATQAMANVLKESFPNRPLRMAISYDSRKFSYEFAQEVACVMAGNQIQAMIYKELQPVPLLSFAVRKLECQAGVMITASHNPKNYNGYKAYWADGAQVTPPHDQNIINAYNKITNYNDILKMDFETAIEKKLIQWIDSTVEDAFYSLILSKSLNKDLCLKRGNELKIVYTPLHGTGLKPCQHILTEMGFKNLLIVDAQAQPDSNFSTLDVGPNPENPKALKMAIELLHKEKADLAFGTDPDTDRLGVVIPLGNEDIFLTGNQMGLLLLNYILLQLKLQNKMPTNPIFIKSIVTSSLQEILAKDYGVRVENTLTGFKWICGLLNKLEINKKNVNLVFATEESFGFLTHDQVRDKDAVCAIAMFSEMALWYKTRNMNVIDGINEIYQKYGYSYEQLLSIDYEGLVGQQKIERIMKHFRNANYSSLLDDPIELFEDYEFQQVKNLENHKMTIIDLPKSNVIGLRMKSGNTLYLRPSGTEPKIKFYIQVLIKGSESIENKNKLAIKKANEIESFIKKQVEHL